MSIVDLWLVPKVELGGFTLEGPTTARLDDLQLIGPDDRPIFEVEHVTVTLAAVPSESEPLRIGRLVFDHPVIYLRPDPTQLGFVPLGFSPLIEPDPLADPSRIDDRMRPSEVLELRYVEIVDGVVVLDDGEKTVLEVDGIGLKLEADPAATPEGTPGHHAHLVFGHPPGVVVESDAHVDLDHMEAWLDQGDLSIELSDPDLVRKLSPKLQALIQEHQLAGHVDGHLTGRFDFRNPLSSTASLSLTIEGLHGAAGAWRLPIEKGRVHAEFADGLAHISEASAQMLGGRLSLSQADLAMSEAELALAGDLLIEDLHLHKLLRKGSDDPSRQSIANGRGRVFLSSEELSFGATLEDFSLAPPGESPVFALRKGEVRDLRPHTTGIPLTIDRVAVEGLEVDLQLTKGGLRGLPLPPPPPAAHDDAPPSEATPAIHWSERLQVRELVLADSAVQIAPVGAAPWRLPGISGTLRSFGGPDDNPLEARLDIGSAAITAKGAIDLRAPLLRFDHWTVRTDLGADSARSLLPPGLRDSIVALVPAGTTTGKGSARFPLGSGAPTVKLALELADGAVALPGFSMPVTAGTADLSVDHGSTRVANASLKGAGGTLTIPAAVLDAGNKLTVSAQAAGLRLDRIRTDAGAGVGMGRLSGRADVAIQFVDGPKGTTIGGLSMEDAKVTIDGDPIGKLVWSDVDLSMTPEGPVLAVKGHMTAGTGGSASLSGTLPIGGDVLTVDQLRIDIDLADPSGRSAMPPSTQVALEDVRGGTLSVVGDGRVSLADPLRKSEAATTLTLSGGAWHYAGYRFAGLSGTAPVGLSGGQLRTNDGAIAGLGGRLGFTEAWWSIADARGSTRWTLTGLDLKQLQSTEGSINTLEGTVRGKGKLDLVVTSEDGLQIPAGQGSLHIRDGKLLAVPALAVLGKEGDKTGDDAMNVRFSLDKRGANLNTVVIDLGPVRYSGSGELRWTGGIDVHLEAAARPGERATLADLTARLVAWDIRGTLDNPHAQALPLGIDTRTFEQKARDPRQGTAADLPENSVLGDDDNTLDDLPEAGANMAPPPPDRTEFGNMDDLDDLDDY